MRLASIVVTALLLVAGEARAEPKRWGVCPLGWAYPRCRVIPVFDVGVRTAPGVEPVGESSPASTTLEGGVIVNLTPRHGVGLVGGFLFDADYPAGILIDRGGPPEVGTVSLILETATSIADVVTLTVSLEHHPRDDGAETLGLVGVRFGLQTLVLPSYLLPDW